MPIEFVQHRTFESNGVQLAAKEWGNPEGKPIIALHGWLDNANSFDKMLPFLEGMHVIAVDMAGIVKVAFAQPIPVMIFGRISPMCWLFLSR